MNLFRAMSLVLAFSAFLKVFFGVFFHEQLYDWARKHYARDHRSAPVNALLVYALLLLIGVWVATLTAYIPSGWILTAFVTLASAKSLSLLLNWEKASSRFVAFIDKAGSKLWWVDLYAAAMGVVFLILALWVY